MIIKPRVETSVREVSLRLYLDHVDCDGVLRKSDNYDSVCSLFVYGKKGYVYNVNGGGFYLGFKEFINTIREYGVETIEGYVVKSHARLIKKECKHLGLEVEFTDPECAYDRTMLWVLIHLSPHLHTASSSTCSNTSS
jgi:hypothetical protein